MTQLGIFARWQPEYASRGFPTFPVKISPDQKQPAVRGYLKIGSVASARLANTFADANAFGLACGRSTGLTVLDVDSNDENLLADALSRHGRTPFVVRTGSGNFQAWYRHGGEKRRVRAWGDDLPIDQLGNGYVVAPPSEGKRRPYEIVEGTLDDLARLPLMLNAWKPGDQHLVRTAAEGGRNNALFMHCMRNAHSCDTLEDVIDVAQTYNEDACIPPLDDNEVIDVAKSAWKYTIDGNNRVGRHGAWLTEASMDAMVRDPYFAALIAWLLAKNGPAAEFMVADGLNDAHFGWPRRKFAAARTKARRLGWIVPLNEPSPGSPVMYRWGKARNQR